MTDAERQLGSAIGKAIRLRRVELDLSRADLARDADVSYTYVSEIENGTKQASSKTLWRIARALGLEPHELLAAAAQWEIRPQAVGAAEPGGNAASDPVTAGRSLGSVTRALAVTVEGGAVRGGAPANPSAPRSRWFHAGRAAAGEGRGGADDRPEATGGESTPEAGPPELVEVLDRIAAALNGVPDERAELALMLSLDERRTRRIVREELDRRGI